MKWELLPAVMPANMMEQMAVKTSAMLRLLSRMKMAPRQKINAKTRYMMNWEKPKRIPEMFPFLTAISQGSFSFSVYLFRIIFSQPNEVTVRMLIIDSVMRLEESLQATSVLALNPVVKAICIAPEMIMSGMSPSATKEVLHSQIKAIVIPAIKLARFWTRMEMQVVVRPLTVWQSLANRAESAPLLFLGWSSQTIGILRILRQVQLRIFWVISSPIVVKMESWITLKMKAAIARMRQMRAQRLASFLAWTGLSLKSMRMASIFARKMLKIGKMTPLQMQTKMPIAKSPFRWLVQENKREKMDCSYFFSSSAFLSFSSSQSDSSAPFSSFSSFSCFCSLFSSLAPAVAATSKVTTPSLTLF